MKIIKPNSEIITPLDGVAILKHIELCRRVCYPIVVDDIVMEDCTSREDLAA